MVMPFLVRFQPLLLQLNDLPAKPAPHGILEIWAYSVRPEVLGGYGLGVHGVDCGEVGNEGGFVVEDDAAGCLAQRELLWCYLGRRMCWC